MDDTIAVYLHDHLAGSSFAVELLEKLASEFAGTTSGEVASELLEEISIDRRTLQRLIAKVGEPNTDIYDALGWVTERLSRVKLKHDDPTGFGAFEAFETLSLGILGKRGLWEALEVQQHNDKRLAGFDYPALKARADEQYNQANQYRLELIQDALNKAESKPQPA